MLKSCFIIEKHGDMNVINYQQHTLLQQKFEILKKHKQYMTALVIQKGQLSYTK